ncbi:MAG: efflux RND transporter periplasmic adaptor subunit [Planctomycetales bacterium]|nr:efflux RND transporter periplasmic adaptor subunit [Planctomycetales bacterium]
MNHRVYLSVLWLLCACFGVQFLGCSVPTSSEPSKEKAAPAKVVAAVSEAALNTLTLTPDAEQRLGITTVPLTQDSVQDRKIFGGELIVPYGKTILVSAPVAGTIVGDAIHPLPTPGIHVHAGDRVLTLQPLLSPERDIPTSAERVQIANARATLIAAQTVATGDVERGRAEVEAGQIALDRAQQLLRDRAGSAKAVDDAQAQLNIAEAAAHAASERQKQLQELASQLDPTMSPTDQASPMPVTAPQRGVIRTLSVSAGQTVTAGTTLFEIVDLSEMWVRVPVYVGLLTRISPTASARIVELGAEHSSDQQAPKVTSDDTGVAHPVTAPPSADPLSSSADLFYAIDNHAGTFRPGQRIGIELTLSDEEKALIVPSSALICDMYGNYWVYAQAGEHQYERRRVELLFTQGDRAALRAGPPLGTPIVAQGAAELFGTEFGAGK